MSSIRKAYKTILKDPFPETMTLKFGDNELIFSKKTWDIKTENGVVSQGLRYGDNPDQPAAMYEWTSGSVKFGEIEIVSGHPIVSGLSVENFIQFGKHPGKTNLTDVNSGLSVLMQLTSTPAAVITKHNNPCGVATADTIHEAYEKAYFADQIAAMGGCIILNRPVNKQTAKMISSSYFEVLAAPDFEEETVEILKSGKNLRIIKLPVLAELEKYSDLSGFRFTNLADGGMIVELTQKPRIKSREDLKPAYHKYKGKEYKINRLPTETEYKDLLLAWIVASGVTSNSVVMVKDGATTAIGTGEQDRVGAVKLAISKAYTKYANKLSQTEYNISIFQLELESLKNGDERYSEIMKKTVENHGGLKGSVMASDGFFPFRDSIDTAVQEGISAFIQPGGSIRDFESIEACNENNAAMVFTDQRVFRH